jgi:hypothetical protein
MNSKEKKEKRVCVGGGSGTLGQFQKVIVILVSGMPGEERMEREKYLNNG